MNKRKETRERGSNLWFSDTMKSVTYFVDKEPRLNIQKREKLSACQWSCQTFLWLFTIPELNSLHFSWKIKFWKPLGHKRGEAIGGWIKLHNEKLHNLYLSPNIIRVGQLRSMIWVRHVTCMEAKRNAYWVWVGKPEGNRQLERPRCRW